MRHFQQMMLELLHLIKKHHLYFFILVCAAASIFNLKIDAAAQIHFANRLLINCLLTIN